MLSRHAASNRGTRFPNRSGRRCSQKRLTSATAAVDCVPDRQVRFTEQFFDQLDELLPTERGADGTPSVTDFLVFDLPSIRDSLARDFVGRTLATGDPDVRVYVGSGALI